MGRLYGKGSINLAFRSLVVTTTTYRITVYYNLLLHISWQVMVTRLLNVEPVEPSYSDVIGDRHLPPLLFWEHHAL